MFQLHMSAEQVWGMQGHINLMGKQVLSFAQIILTRNLHILVNVCQILNFENEPNYRNTTHSMEIQKSDFFYI